MYLLRLDFIEKSLLWVLSGFLFWPHAISSIVLALLAITRLVRIRKHFFDLRFHWLMLLPPFLLLIAWLVHGAADTGWQEVQLMGIWVAALFYFGSSPFSKIFIKGFILMSAAQAVFAIIWLIVNYEILSSESFRETLGTGLKVHPTYMSAAWLWALSLMFLSETYKNSWVGALLLVMGVIAGGRMPLLAFAVVLAFWCVAKFRYDRKMKPVIIALTLVVIVLVFPALFPRFEELANIRQDIFADGHWLTSIELRIGVWKCTMHTVRHHWLLGLGTGNTRGALETCFTGYGNAQFFSTEFNSHNQFLHFWLIGGVAAFVAFLAYWLWFFWNAYLLKAKTLFFFLLYAGLLMLTENYFSRQAGIMLVSLMLFCLYSQSGAQKSSSKLTSM